MGKTKQKRHKCNETVIKELIQKYGVTHRYILMSIAGDRNGALPIKIQEDYRQLNAAVKKTIKAKIGKL